MTTTRAVADDLRNAIDYLVRAELVLYANEVSRTPTRVSWHGYDDLFSVRISAPHATVREYLEWVSAGAYSAVLPDASLLQLTYDVADGQIVGHRLAYVPCPYVIDEGLLQAGEPIADVVEIYAETGESQVALRSPVRFDYDAGAARGGHPAAHLTVNSSDCRIACVAPMHAHQFIAFVFGHFYPQLRSLHDHFFSECSRRHIGRRVITDAEREEPHMMWSYQKAPGP